MTTQPRTCPGPAHACMAAYVVLPYGVARHPTALPCVACGRTATMLRFVHDPGAGLPAGHLCRLCDPLARPTPDERNSR